VREVRVMPVCLVARRLGDSSREGSSWTAAEWARRVVVERNPRSWRARGRRWWSFMMKVWKV